MQMLSLPQLLLVTVFRAARSGRRPNLTAFCKRVGAMPAELQGAFDELERAGFLSFCPQGERLTLEGLAVGAALSRRASERHRPLASCRPLAA
jgi:DNA-binding IclR family transcriptional regulator